MRIAIIGGTGTLGRLVAAQLRDRGHEIRVLSRSAPQHRVDLRTGAGLEEALGDCQAVVDASNDSSRDAAQLLVGGTRRLLAAEQAAGVTHHVGVSVVGCEMVPLGYFRAKAAQEQVLEHGPVPWTIVRATQFHELAAATLASAARWRLVPVPAVLLQTVAAAEVAAVVAGAAAGSPRAGRVVVAGPEVSTARAMAATWRQVTRSPAVAVPVWLPRRIGRLLRGGALTAPNPDVRGTITFAAWLEATCRRQQGAEGQTAGEYRSAARPG